MTQQEYEQCKIDNQAIEMIRPFWDYSYKPYPENVTVLICQGKQRFLTALTIESLMRFYPEIPILVVNGSPDDYDSTLYLQLMELKHKNIKVWHRFGINSHGDMMNEAIRQYIDTEFVLLMDNDNIIHRGGFVEGMLKQLKDKQMFATGATMIVTREGEGIGPPHNDTDVLRYPHPSCAIIKRSVYLKLDVNFSNHGAPCIYSIIESEKEGYTVGSYPVSEYESHLSGASWCKPATIWYNDHDVMLRPFITFIVTNPVQITDLQAQSDHDFEIQALGKKIQEEVIIHDGNPKKEVDNRLYDIRLRVKGDYVCLLLENVIGISADYVIKLRQEVIEMKYPDELEFGGLRIVKRKKWQYEDCLYNKF